MARPRYEHDGYVLIYVPKHPRNSNGYVREHVLVAETALGKFLPAGAQVHHVNEDKSDNRGSNLVILQSRADHVQLHARLRVMRAGGDPWKHYFCPGCEGTFSCDAFYWRADGTHVYLCKTCVSKDNRRRYSTT
jgi:hypothetical protein